MKYQERLSIYSKVEWTPEEIKKAEKEEGFKVIQHSLDGMSDKGEYIYNTLVEWQ